MGYIEENKDLFRIFFVLTTLELLGIPTILFWNEVLGNVIMAIFIVPWTFYYFVLLHNYIPYKLSDSSQ